MAAINTDGRLYRPLLVITAAVLLLAICAAWSYNRLLSSQQWKAHTYQVLNEIYRFNITTLSAGGLIRCVASGDARLIEHKGWERGIDDSLARLRQLTADNPAQSARIQTLQQISDQWRSEYVVPTQKACEQARMGKPDANLASRLTGASLQYRQQIKALIEEFESNELALLAQRDAHARQSQRISNLLLLLGLLGVIGLITLFVWAQLRSTQALKSLNLALEDKIAQQDQTQARLQASETRAHAIIDNVFDAIVTMDRHGVIRSFNRSAVGIFGYSADEAIAHSVLMLFPESESAMLSNYFFQRQVDDAHAEPLAQIRECYARHKDGRLFPVELSLSEMRLDGELYLIGLMRDITERRRVEVMKNEFVSTVSHELRTPLTAIRGALGLIAGTMAAQLPPQLRSLVDIALNNSERLVRLINDILDIEKIESGNMRFEITTLELAPLIRHAVQANQGYADQYGVQLKIEQPLPDCRVKADADRVMQLMANLLSNAAKFSPSAAEVTVSVKAERDHVRISVTDRGPGIPLNFQGKIFQKFSQADSSDTRIKGGTGLGLSICKAIVEHMGGTIGFDTVIGQGTTMYFTLPLAQAEIALPASAATTNAGPRLLVCEDDPDIASLLRIILQQAGYQVDIAADADQALAMLLTGDYVAMTLDIALPGKDGLSLLKELYAHEETRCLRVVVVSAKANEAQQQKQLGDIMVVDWIDKPIDQARLLRSMGVASAESSGSLRVLHVEDDPDIQVVIRGMLINECELTAAATLADAKQQCLQKRFDVIILDIGLPDGSGLALLPFLAENEIITPVVVFSAMELSTRDSAEISVALVKSRTSDQQLLDTILGLARAAARKDHAQPSEKGLP